MNFKQYISEYRVENENLMNIDVALITMQVRMLIQVGGVTGILKFKRYFTLPFLNQRQRCITLIILKVLMFL